MMELYAFIRPILYCTSVPLILTYRVLTACIVLHVAMMYMYEVSMDEGNLISMHVGYLIV